MLEIDALGTFNMSKEVFNQTMSDRREGVIINIGAEIQKNGSALQAHSAAGKAGVDALTNVLACEWGPHGIRVVGIIPGGITGTEGMARIANLSNMNNREETNTAVSKKGTAPPKDVLTEGIPAQRFGEVEDIANAALYLASPAASYVTGANLVVDGGSDLTFPSIPPRRKNSFCYRSNI